MKSILFTIITIVAFTVSTNAQIDSFQTIKNKFGWRDNVHSFSGSGFLARTVLWLAGEHDYKNSINDVRSVRLITIPKQAFADANVTVNGLKKLLRKDSYETLAEVKDHDDDVTLYMQSSKKSSINRYFLLVDNKTELVAIELRGSIDPQILTKVYDN